MSFFSQVQTVSIDIFALFMRFYADTDENKINLAIGAYRDSNGNPWTLPVVRKVEKDLACDDRLNKEYLPVLGLDEFTEGATKWLLGENSVAIREKRPFGIQSVSGAGALRIGAEFLNRILGRTVFYFSNPTWRSHRLLFQSAGFLDAREYRYWCHESQSLDFEGLVQDLRNAPEGSIIILHASAHNPTGCDPSKDQWIGIADVMEERNLFPFFDSALQGFASGNAEEDAAVVRYFVNRGFEMFCAQSFSKNFGLYNERVGNLTIVLKDSKFVASVKSQFTLIVRGMYSNPPSHGAQIVAHILNNPKLYREWKENFQTIFKRINEMRKQLREALEKLDTPGDWSGITQQCGMACTIPLNEIQCEHLMKEHHIYILRSGRFNICGVTPSNVDYIADAIYKTVIYYARNLNDLNIQKMSTLPDTKL